MRMGIIYKAINKINGDFYIGKTIRPLKERIKKHYKNAYNVNNTIYNSKFYCAIRKYGKENFQWEILYQDVPEDRLDVAEICAIYIFNSYDGGYNMTFGGDGGAGHWMGKQHKLSTKIKMSKNNIWNSPTAEQHRQNQRINNLGCLNPNFENFLSKQKKEKISILCGGKLFDVFKKNTNEHIGSWINKHACAIDLKCFRSNIIACLSGKAKSTRGYVFKYRDLLKDDK
jgi:group I intron endonuclease